MTPLRPNRLPRVSRDLIDSITANLADEIREQVALRFLEVQDQLPGDPPETSWLQTLFLDERVGVAALEVEGPRGERLVVRAAIRYAKVQRLGHAVPTGSYDPRRKVLQVDLEGSHPISTFLEEPKGATYLPWQESLRAVIAHELTHASDPLVHLGKKYVPLQEDVRRYFRQVEERKAFSRMIAEEVAAKVEYYRKKSPVTWRRIWDTPEEVITHTIHQSTVWPELRAHLSAKQQRQMFKDIYQFLDEEGLLVVIWSKYTPQPINHKLIQKYVDAKRKYAIDDDSDEAWEAGSTIWAEMSGEERRIAGKILRGEA